MLGCRGAVIILGILWKYGQPVLCAYTETKQMGAVPHCAPVRILLQVLQVHWHSSAARVQHGKLLNTHWIVACST